MYFTFSADLLKIDSKKAKEAIDKFIEHEFKMAIRDFVDIAAPAIPVDTGMARGSLLHIGAAVGRQVSISPNKERTVTLYKMTKKGTVSVKGKKYTIDYRKHPPKYWHSPARGKKKTPELGAALTTPKGIEDLLIKTSTGYKFTINTNIYHLTLNDLLGSKGTGPWYAYLRGRQAMTARLSTMKERWPGLKKFVLKSRLSVGRGGIVRSESFRPLSGQLTIGR